MSSNYKKLKAEVEKGITGKNQGIPLSLKKAGKYLSIRQAVYTLIGGHSGCLAKDTGVVMFNGTIKSVEDIKPGDVLMGPDSTARIVQELKRGVQQMYWIRQNKGVDYEVNEGHVLHLRSIGVKYSKKVIPGQLHIPKNKRKREYVASEAQKVETCNITVRDVLKKPKSFLGVWKGYKVGIEMSCREIEIEPYMLGIWLGDGSSAAAAITNIEPEILEYMNTYAIQYGYKLRKNKIIYHIGRNEGSKRAVIGRSIGGSVSIEYESVEDAAIDRNIAATNISSAIRKNRQSGGYLWKYKNDNKQCLKNKLDSIGVINNKHIPDDYKYNSRENRLQLLAGLIDTDGNRDAGGYQITQKNKRLAHDILYLCRSLGYYTSIVEKTATMKRKNGSVYKCQVWKLEINGNSLYEIPCKVDRKKITAKSTRVTDALSTSIVLEKSEIKEYYGFTLDKDNLFLLSDFTVTHNTGKTSYADTVYVLEPYQWYLDNRDNTHLKIQWVYRSMERPLLQKLAKWSCYKIWKDHSVLITPDKLLGWTEIKLNNYEKDLFDSCEDFFETMQDSGIITIIEGQDNPRGIWKQLEEYALHRGVYEQKSEYERVYHPNDPHLIVMPVIDHAGKCKMETVDGIKSRKGTTDKLSEYMSICRDLFKMSPVVVSQFNRNTKNEIYSKQSDPEPTMESFKETGNLYEDCDVAQSLFNPYKFKVMDHAGYNIPGFVDGNTGANYFRSLKMIKNQGEDDIRWAMAFMGQIGMFRDMSKSSEITQEEIDSIKNLQHFQTQMPEMIQRPFAGMGKSRVH